MLTPLIPAKIAKEAIKKYGSVAAAFLNTAKNGQLEVVQYFLETYGQDAEARRVVLGVVEALKSAAGHGQVAVVQCILGVYGEDATIGYRYELLHAGERAGSLAARALWCAAQEGQLAVVQYLLETYGQDAKAINTLGVAKALKSAAEHGQLEIVRCLLETYGQNAEVRAALGATEALVKAVEHGQLEVVRYLLGAYAQDNEARDVLGITKALKSAVRRGQLAIVRYILETYGKDTEARAALGIRKAFIGEFEGAVFDDYRAVIDYILEAYGQTAEARAALGVAETFMNAAQEGRIGLAKYLLKAFNQDPAIIQAIEHEFSPNVLEAHRNLSKGEYLFLISAIIDLKNLTLLTIITKPEVITFFQVLHQEQLDEDEELDEMFQMFQAEDLETQKVINLLNQAKLGAEILKIRNQAKSLQEATSNFKQHQMAHKQLVNTATRINVLTQATTIPQLKNILSSLMEDMLLINTKAQPQPVTVNLSDNAAAFGNTGTASLLIDYNTKTGFAVTYSNQTNSAIPAPVEQAIRSIFGVQISINPQDTSLGYRYK